MKKVVYAPAVELSLGALDPDGVRRVHAWFDYLAQWDEEEAVRKSSVELPGHPGVHLLRTSTDLRIFFRIDGDTITVLDVAKLSTILASGGIRVGGSADFASIPGKTTGE
jgi:hypothetical protein